MLQFEKRGAAALLRLNRPERRNAMGVEMVDHLAKALDEIDADSGLRAVVLSGAEPGFCAGSDLKELAALDTAGICKHEAQTAALCRRLASFSKPVIAAVEGFAIGGGFVFAIAADVVVSARAAKWHLPEVSLGWIIPWGLQSLVRRVGYTRATMLAWGAEAIDAAEAYRLGVVDALVDAGGVENYAIALAEKLAALPPHAVTATKNFFNTLAMIEDSAKVDARATAIFEKHCDTDAARATFARMRTKARTKS